MMVMCSAVAGAQNDSHQLAPDTMKVPDSLSHPDNQPPSAAQPAQNNAAPDQRDQISDSDAKKNDLNKLIPNIAIGRDNHTQNNIADIMNLIASMPEGVQESLMADAAHAKNYCENNTLLMSFYDCSCYSLEIVNERIKKGPDVAFIYLIEAGQYKECIDMGQVAGYGLNRCTQTLTTLNVTSGQLNDICECAGRVLARNYIIKPMPSFVFINYLFTDVLAACRAQYGF